MAQKSRSKDIRCDNAVEFIVSHGITVELVKGVSGRTFSMESVKRILMRHKKYAECYGCYIYSIKAGRGFTPIYVGSATRQSLGKEAFNSDKLVKCMNHLTGYKKGSLQITFIVPKDKVDNSMSTRRGRRPSKIIECMEKALTAVAYRKNKSLENKHNRCVSGFFINGALNSNAGRPRKEVVAFKDMIGLSDKALVVI